MAVEETGVPVVHLVSGAGHDGVTMASLTEVGMLFVRCKGGISHNPAEAVTVDDVAVSIDVLGRLLKLLADA
jgi:allantoate deiminase